MGKPIPEKEGNQGLMHSYLGLAGSTLPYLLGPAPMSASGPPAEMHILMDPRGAGLCSEADFILNHLLQCCELCWAWVADGWWASLSVL